VGKSSAVHRDSSHVFAAPQESAAGPKATFAERPVFGALWTRPRSWDPGEIKRLLKAVVTVEQGAVGAAIASPTTCPLDPNKFSAVIALSPNHGMEAALPSWSVRTVMYFDPDTIALLRTTLDRVWAGLPPTRRALTSQSVLAERILRAAARGERNPDRLRAHALSERADLKIAS
jgi:hypothetical protein